MSNGQSYFIYAKTMVAPLKTKTVPRLELLAAQLAVRMLRPIKKVLGERIRTIVWSDSEVALHWVETGAKSCKAFTSARLQEIYENEPRASEIFRHIPGTLNPADALTKPTVTPETLGSWLAGPAFILKDEDEWPKSNPVLSESTKAAIKQEQKPKPKGRKRAQKKKIATPRVNHIRGPKLSDLEEWAEKAENWKELMDKVTQELSQDGVARREMALAELFKAAQRNLDKRELEEDSMGVLRKTGRLQGDHLPEHLKHPVLLDGKSEITRRYLENVHESTHHRGENFLLGHAFAEKGVQITRGKRLASIIVKSCPECREERGKPHTPKMGKLPEERMLIKHLQR